MMADASERMEAIGAEVRRFLDGVPGRRKRRKRRLITAAVGFAAGAAASLVAMGALWFRGNREL
jgi:hypothetical protein